MTSEAIHDVLRQGDFVTADRVRDELIEAARHQVAARGPGAPVSSRRRLGIALASIALLVALAFTPAGEAATAWIGRLVGVGEVGGPPTIQPHHGTPASPPLVIGNGVAPDGTHYEIVEYRTTDKELCFALSFPKPEARRAGEWCSTGGPVPRALGGWGASFSNQEVTSPRVGFVNGEIGPKVEAVRLRYRTSDGRAGSSSATVAFPDASIRHRIGTGAKLGFFIGFVPRRASPMDAGWIQVSTYDDNGRLIDREDTRG